MELNKENVNKIFDECLYRENDKGIPEGVQVILPIADGGRPIILFNGEKLEKYKKDIEEMVNEVYFLSERGKTVFSNLILTTNFNFWTFDKHDIQKFYLLAAVTDQVLFNQETGEIKRIAKKDRVVHTKEVSYEGIKVLNKANDLRKS